MPPPPVRSPPQSSRAVQHSRLDVVPWQELALDRTSKVLAATLGRERTGGRVVVITWKGVDVVVKILSIGEGETTKHLQRRLKLTASLELLCCGVLPYQGQFLPLSKMEFEPGVRALGLEVGGKLPHVNTWTPLMFSQARD